MSNGAYDTKWGQDVAGQITNQVKEEVQKIRQVRPLIPVVPGGMAYVKTVVDTTVTVATTGVSINPSGTLAPIRLSRPFFVKPEQFDDLVTISQAAVNAGYDLAEDEDAVLLLGASAVKAAVAFRSTDESGTLGSQVGLLSAVPTAAITKTVDQSILDAIKTLRTNGHFGPFCVVLAPDLHQAAYTPIPGSAVPLIAPILPQLRQDGLQFSPALRDGSGVVFSVGKAAIDLVIPWDVHVECRDIQAGGDAIFVVIEQFRLRINDVNATVALK